jgi:hypothetical protein
MEPRVLFYLEHAIQDASLTREGSRRVVSKRMLYVEHGRAGHTRHVHYAPYLDYRPLRRATRHRGHPRPPECQWITATWSSGPWAMPSPRSCPSTWPR